MSDLYKIKTLSDHRTQFEFCGALVDLFYNKDIFKYNKDIAEVVYKVYEIEFKKYVLSSRSLMIGKVLKNIIGKKYNKEEVLCIQKIILDNYKPDKVHNKSQRNSSVNNIQLLISGILNDS